MGKPSAIYSQSVAEKIESKLEQLAQTPKGLTVKQMVFQLRPKIEEAQAMGHTLEDIVNLFKSDGVDLTLNTLKRYLQESRAEGNNPPNTDNPPGAKPRRTRVRKEKEGKKSESDHTANGTGTGSPAPAAATQSGAAEAEKVNPVPLTNTDDNGFQTMVADDEL